MVSCSFKIHGNNIKLWRDRNRGCFTKRHPWFRIHNTSLCGIETGSGSKTINPENWMNFQHVGFRSHSGPNDLIGPTARCNIYTLKELPWIQTNSESWPWKWYIFCQHHWINISNHHQPRITIPNDNIHYQYHSLLYTVINILLVTINHSIFTVTNNSQPPPTKIDHRVESSLPKGWASLGCRTHST